MTSEVKPANDMQDDTQPPPPTYQSVIYKIGDYSSSTSYDARPAPPSYSDLNPTSVVHINNYPGPPLTDGTVQIITGPQVSTDQQRSAESFLTKKLRLFSIINGIITIALGLVTIGLQVGLIVSHSMLYYYFGFWAGALILSIGISTLMFNSGHHAYNLRRYFRSFIWQAIFIGIVFCLGIIIFVTDKCDKKSSNSDSDEEKCNSSYKILNGFLLGIIGVSLLQSIVNILIIAMVRRRYYGM